MVFDSIPGVALSDTAAKDVGTTAAAGTSVLASRYDHVHDTAAGFIDSSDKFASGVVDTAALKAAAVTGAKIADSTIASGKLTFGTWEKISDTYFSTAATTLTITGLDINTHKCYMMIINLVNDAAVGSAYQLFVEGDTTATNYYSQYIIATGTSLTADRSNDAGIGYTEAGDRLSTILFIFRDPDGYYRVNLLLQRYTGSAVCYFDRRICKTAPVTNITRLDLIASQTNGLGVGTRVMLFKVSA